MARPTMVDLIAQVRWLTAAGTADYVIASVGYWSDAQIEGALDANRLDVIDEPLHGQVETTATGSQEYHQYRSQYRWMEATDGGTAIFYLRDSSGARIGTADYTVDYQAGRVSLIPDTQGAALYLTARSYDVYAAAASIWRTKAAHVASRFDFTADGASFKASQLRASFLDQAKEMDKLSTFGETSGVRSITMTRDDIWVY